jgi:hypothetical protein
VCSVIIRNATVTGISFSAPFFTLVSLFHCRYGATFDSYQENLVELGGESCSSCRKSGSDSCLPVYR